MDGSGGFKSKDEGFGDGDEDDMLGQAPNSKGRRRNVKRHLEAERERRKHVKGKLQVMSWSGNSGRHLAHWMEADLSHLRNWTTCYQSPLLAHEL
jgi:hypothetical protein